MVGADARQLPSEGRVVTRRRVDPAEQELLGAERGQQLLRRLFVRVTGVKRAHDAGGDTARGARQRGQPTDQHGTPCRGRVPPAPVAPPHHDS
jgi:hypothetical protein